MQKIKNKISFLALVLLFVSCDENVFFDEYQEFDGTWKKNKKATFTFNQNDTKSAFNLFLNIRNNNDYPYNNLFVIVNLNQPNGQVIVDTLEYEMAAPDGTLLGTGFSDIKESKLEYKSNYSFPKAGKYTVEIKQALRKTGSVKPDVDLKGVTEIGFRIEKTK
jgi:gliding motility-associated lipoprotein GldH